VFARLIPFVLGLGVVLGLTVAAADANRGGGRRFTAGVVALQRTATAGLVLAMATGAWAYLKGVLDVTSPLPMWLVYRLHYVGAALLMLGVAALLAYWWTRGAAALLVPRGGRIRHLRGLAHELPRPLGGALAGLLGLNMRLAPPERERFTFYEKLVSFPTWALLIGLILATGLIKAMRYLYPMPGELVWWASTLHVVGLVLLAVKLLDHLRVRLGASNGALLILSAISWTIVSAVAAYGFVVGGLAQQTAAKGLFQQGLLVGGGLAIGLFALGLLIASVRWLIARPARG
jgi:hypothetical protein